MLPKNFTTDTNLKARYELVRNPFQNTFKALPTARQETKPNVNKAFFENLGNSGW